MKTPAILATLGAVLAACAPTSPSRPERLQWGLYQIHWAPHAYASMLDETVEHLASPPDFVMFYRALSHLDYPALACEAIRSHGATPIVSLELGMWGSDRSYLDDIVTGTYDEQFDAWAAGAREDGRDVVLRPGFEMNGEWFSWSGDPPTFVVAWRHIHARFARAGATNVTWFWCPNVVGIPRTDDNAMHLYYPGDDVVDWVGLDGYNFGDHHDEWHAWESLEDVLAGPLDTLAAIAPGKPIYVGETASAPGEPGQKAAWIRAAHAWLVARRDVHGVIWFNLDKRRENEPDWRIGSSADALAAFNETFAAPRPVR